MVSSEVQRTLVKSPPELWAELSDPAALARHLGEFGEIRITRTDPEKVVEWEAEGTTGKVTIKPSGWGTKVTLSVARELTASEPAEEQAVDDLLAEELAVGPLTEGEPAPIDYESWQREAADQLEPTPEPTFATQEPTFATRDELESEAEFEPQAEFEPEPEVELQPRRGFFARLFGRRRQSTPVTAPSLPGGYLEPDPLEADPLEGDPLAPDPIDAPEADPWREMVLEDAHLDEAEERLMTEDSASLAAPESESIAAQEPQIADAEPESISTEDPPLEAGSEPPADLAAELRAAEVLAAEEVTAVLTAALDRLGAAHHRPFSRA
jgi:hypothetical protein